MFGQLLSISPAQIRSGGTGMQSAALGGYTHAHMTHTKRSPVRAEQTEPAFDSGEESGAEPISNFENIFGAWHTFAPSYQLERGHHVATGEATPGKCRQVPAGHRGGAPDEGSRKRGVQGKTIRHSVHRGGFRVRKTTT